MNEVSIIKRQSLTSAQTSLYELIQSKLKDDKPLLFIEAKSIYVQKACKNLKDDWPQTWNNWHHKNEADEWVGGWQPLTEYGLNIAVIQWVMYNIGALVLKGYLKVIPVVELNPVNPS